jgi:hypothetical protein
MTRPITQRFVLRTLNRLGRIAYHLRDEKFAKALVNAGFKSKRFRYLAAYLSNIAFLMARFEPPTTEPRRCPECGNTFTAYLQHPVSAALTHRYCSHKCCQRAYVKRRAARMADENVCSNTCIASCDEVIGLVIDNQHASHMNAIMSMLATLTVLQYRKIMGRPAKPSRPSGS